MTKNEPGKYDCYAKAADDEPLFTLRAKDPVAPYLVMAWRYLRANELGAAMDSMANADAIWRRSGLPLLPLNSEKSIEAEQCALAMKKWREASLSKGEEG